MSWSRPIATVTHAVAVLLLLAMLHASSLTAQGPLGEPPGPELLLGDQLSLGLTAAVAIPQGEFAEFAGLGFELNAHVLVVNRAGWLGLRVSGAGALYRTVGSPVVGVGTLTVGNRMATLDLGPQVLRPVGAVRPYGYATVGGTFVRTDPSIAGPTALLSQDPVYTDVTHLFKIGGGLYVPLTTGSRSVSLDFGAHYRWNGGTQFLPGSRIVRTPSGQLDLDPIRRSPRLLVLSLGVAVGL